MKKTLLLATGALVAAGFAATDAKAVDVELYGQVNKTVAHADNGTNSDTTIVDNENSSTRIGFKGEQALDNGLTASVLLEMELDANDGSDRQDLTAGATNPDARDNGTNLRHSRVGLAGDFGAVFLGHTSQATDGILEIDNAGVSDLLGSDMTAFGGGIALVDTDTTADANEFTFAAGSGAFDFAGRTLANNEVDLDGGRADVIAYHSPVIAGFQGQVSYNENENVELAARYSGKFDAFAVKAGLGYTYDNSTADFAFAGASAGVNVEPVTAVKGSVTVAHDSGLAASFAYAMTEQEAIDGEIFTGTNNDTDDRAETEATQMYAKVGYKWDAFEVAADYGIMNQEITGTDDIDGSVTSAENISEEVETKVMGLGAQYNLGHGVSVAAAYRTYETEVSDAQTSFDDVDVFMANLRVKF